MSLITAEVQQAIELALAKRDIAGAAELAEKAIEQGQRDPMLLNLAAWKREEAGEYDASLALLDEALTSAPRDPAIIGAIGAVLRKQGKLREALSRLDEAIRLDPTAAAPWLERGMALASGGSLDAAMASYYRAAELDPGSASAFGGVASIAARRGDHDVAIRFGERALQLDPLDPPGAGGVARVEIDRGHPEKAVTVLERVLATGLSDENRSNLASLLGDARDRLKRYDEAFEAYADSNEASARRFARLPANIEPLRDTIERLAREFSAIDAHCWSAGKFDGPSPAFLIGYPRSGTTLLENMLASVPGVVALEERATLADSAEFLREGGLAKLAKADTAKLQRLRSAYWQSVKSAGVDAAGKLFVDKDPLKGAWLPVISRLFPEARIIVMRRDPRDVVWSCFRGNFAPTPAAIVFTDLKQAALHYDATMRAQEAFLAALPLACHEVHYEALVANFEAETRSLCDFLGIEWTEEMLNFASTARRRGVATLSASQVSKPLYDGSRQWQRYEAHLAPILPILDPWVERFGYA